MIELTEAQQMLRGVVRDFADAEIDPIADEMDRDDRWYPHLWPMLGDLGLHGVTIDERYGGSDAGLLAGVIATEELARVSASVALSYGAHANLCANNIATNGSDQQKQRYLPGLCRGTEVGALALTEPEAGSDAIGIRTTAVREGDVYRLNGTKMFITNGSVADTLVLYAKTDPEAGSRGITAFIVESSFAGFSVGQKLDKVGHRGSPTAELLLEDCIVPADNVLGREGGGAAVMMQGLAVERSFLAGEPLGIAQAALDAAVAVDRVLDALLDRGWDDSVSTDGPIVMSLPFDGVVHDVAVVLIDPDITLAADLLERAIRHAEQLDVPYAFVTNGEAFRRSNLLKRTRTNAMPMSSFPTSDQLQSELAGHFTTRATTPRERERFGRLFRR